MHSSIKHLMDLSTAHVPSSTPDWGTLRWEEHASGWVVFVMDLDHEQIMERVPKWLRPIWKIAQDSDCLIINFDQDGEVYPDFFEVYNW